MKWAIREAVDVYFKAKSVFKLGARTIRAGEPVLILDTTKTSTLEVATQMSYVTGGRGNNRILSYEGDKTVTFSFDDCLLSAEGLAILSGADLIPARNGKLKGSSPEARSIVAHTTEKYSVVTNNIIDEYFDRGKKLGKADGTNVYDTDTTINGIPRGGINNVWLSEKPYVGQNASIYVMLLDDAGEMSGAPLQINLKNPDRVDTTATYARTDVFATYADLINKLNSTDTDIPPAGSYVYVKKDETKDFEQTKYQVIENPGKYNIFEVNVVENVAIAVYCATMQEAQVFPGLAARAVPGVPGSGSMVAIGERPNEAVIYECIQAMAPAAKDTVRYVGKDHTRLDNVDLISYSKQTYICHFETGDTFVAFDRYNQPISLTAWPDPSTMLSQTNPSTGKTYFIDDAYGNYMNAAFDDEVEYYVDFASAKANWASGWGNINGYKRTITADQYNERITEEDLAFVHHKMVATGDDVSDIVKTYGLVIANGAVATFKVGFLRAADPTHATEDQDDYYISIRDITIENNAGVYTVNTLGAEQTTLHDYAYLLAPSGGVAAPRCFKEGTSFVYKVNVPSVLYQDIVLIDYYKEHRHDATQISILPDKFAPFMYVEGSSLLRRASDGVDLPVEFVIPKLKITTAITLTMQGTGDAASFSFKGDAYPDFSKFDLSRKVLADIQILDADDNFDGSGDAGGDPTSYRRYKYNNDSDGEYLWKDPSIEEHQNLDFSDIEAILDPYAGGPSSRTPGTGVFDTDERSNFNIGQ